MSLVLKKKETSSEPGSFFTHVSEAADFAGDFLQFAFSIVNSVTDKGFKLSAIYHCELLWEKDILLSF